MDLESSHQLKIHKLVGVVSYKAALPHCI